MEDNKDASIFSIIRNYWRRNPTVVTRVESYDEQQKEHKEAYQNTYSNFWSKFDLAQQILPSSAEEKEPADRTVQDVAFNYCNEATIHGIRHLVPSTNKIRRFIYLIIVLVFSGILFKFLLGILILYSTNPYKTYYYAEMMKILQFPTVTMCNVESMFSSFNTSYEHNKSLENILMNYIPDTITIEECEFNGNKCHETTPTIMIIRRRIYGCYIIRPAINRTFVMEDLKNNNGLAVDVTTKKTSGKGEKGVQVFLHEDKTFASQMDSSFFAGPRDATFVAIQPQKVNKLGSPYHAPGEDCRKNDSPSFENPLKFYKSYSQTNCQRECTSLYIEEYCNCTIPYYPGNSTPCTFYDYMHCVRIHLNASMSEETYLYRCKCTPNCSYLQYDSRVSVAHMRYNKRSKEDMFRIRVYFENMVMKFLKEKPKYELEDLLASFGGQMGLFIGASIISIYEFLEFTFLFLWTCLTGHFRKSETQFKRTAAVRKKTPLKK